MKNMSKILGIILTVAMLAGLLMMAVPVSAATNGWSELSQPKVTVGTNANVFAVAPDGKTMFVYTNGPETQKLWKSTDAGLTWTNTGLGTGLTGLAIVELKVSPNYASDSMLIVATTTTLYRTINGGNSWGMFGTPTSYVGGTITSIDLASDQSIAVAWANGGAGGVSVYNTNNLAWSANTVSGDAYAVALSPNYANDATVLAVVLSAGTAYLRTSVNSGVWGADVKPGTLAVTSTVGSASIAFPSDYDWASSSNKVFVGLGGTTPLTVADVYRVNGKISGATSTVYPLGSGVNASDVAYKGTSSAGTFAVAAIDSVQISSSTNAISASSPDWYASDTYSSPSSDSATPNVKLAFSAASNLLYAGSQGAHSNLTVSSDFMAFKGFAFISVSAISYTSGTVSNPSLGKLTGAGTPNQFIRLTDGTGVTAVKMIFASTDSGLTWKEILYNNTYGVDSIKLSPTYATDKTLYLTQRTNAGVAYNRILKSSDGGMTWATQSAPGNVNVDQIALVDANTYWVASSTGGNAGVTYGLRLSTSTITAPIDGRTASTISILPFGILVPTLTGEFYLSTDTGVTFNKLGTDGQFLAQTTGPNFTIDVPNKTIYAQEYSSKNIMKYTVGTDTVWSTYLNNSELPSAMTLWETSAYNGMHTSISLVSGVWYFNELGNTAGQIWQSVDTTDNNNHGFAPVTDTTIPGGIGGTITPGPQLAPKDATGVTTLTDIVNRSTLPTNEYYQAIMVFGNTILAAPATIAPAAAASTDSGTVDFSWKSVAGSNIKYDLQIAYDTAFTSLALANANNVSLTSFPYATTVSYAQVSSNIVAGVVLNPGRTYYWRVRVVAPMISQWSTGVTFTTKPTSSGTSNIAGLDTAGRLSPVSGATNISTTTAITWGAVTGATAYNFKLSTDPTFATVVDSKDGYTSTAYVPAKALDAGKTYFWEVQSVSGTATSNWIVSAFTTAAAGTGPGATFTAPPQTIVIPTPIFNIPTATVIVPSSTGIPVAPATPGYIWVIIVIGAVLVIAVVVLIVRTRRV